MNFATFDLNLLRVFQALLSERSVTRAGDRLALSQPAVSAALSRLRHAIGNELFVRQGNAMLPTTLALAIADKVGDALAAIEAALTEAAGFAPATESGMFTLAGADFFANLLVPPLYQRIARAAPGIVLRMIDNARGDVATLLGDGHCDLALDTIMTVPEWLLYAPLFDAPFALVAARGDPALAGLVEGSALPLDLFCALPHALRSVDGSLHGFTDAALDRIGRTRRVMLAMPHFHGVAMAVSGGGLIALLPVQYARVMAGPLNLALYAPPLEIPTPQIGMYWHRRRNADPAHAWLRDQIRAVVTVITR